MAASKDRQQSMLAQACRVADRDAVDDPMSDLTLNQALNRDPEFRTTAENLMADRIDELEAALRTIRLAPEVVTTTDMRTIARRALEADG